MADESDYIVDILGQHQTAQTAFFEMLEGIRWKFVSTFGVGGVLSLFTSKGLFSWSSVPTAGLAILAIIISAAALVIQMRICILLDLTWRRITELQNLKVERLIAIESLLNDYKSALLFPKAGSFSRQPLLHLMSVHSAVCAVFSAILSISFCDLWQLQSASWAIVTGLVFFASLTLSIALPVLIGQKLESQLDVITTESVAIEESKTLEGNRN